MNELQAQANQALLHELEPTAAELLERHLKTAREWFPHEIVPWSRGQDFTPGEMWDQTSSNLPQAVRDSLRLNLLTEDNLPYYFNLLSSTYGSDGIWGTWARRWTAEEGRHSIVIRDYLTVTNSVDLRQLERDRMNQVSGGQIPNPEGVDENIVYVALQELATRIAHRNTGKLLGDPDGKAVMERVARDENLHHLFYRDLVKAALEINPSRMVIAIEKQVKKFDMPGTGIDGYPVLKKQIAKVGIFGATEFTEEVVKPTLGLHWNIWELPNLTPEAEQKREKIASRIRALGKVVVKEQKEREEYQDLQAD